MSILSDDGFRPPWWLRGGHRQSILAGLPVRRGAIERRTFSLCASAHEWLLDSGERLAILMHGWEGSADSLYILSASQALFDAGFEVVRLNFRDHGATHHLNEDMFHSCRLPEVQGAVRAVQSAMPDKQLHLIGFSLGGNFALRIAATAAKANIKVAHTLAVSPLLDPKRTLLRLDRRASIYHKYFVLKWGRSLLKKQAAWPDRYHFGSVMRSRNLLRMTDELVRQHTEYPSMDSYLAGYALTGDRLATLTTPATILAALDDPIIEADDLNKLAFPGSLRVRLTTTGGHCGYLTDWTGPSWVDRIMLEEFARS
jgi:uncharacterized protein